MRSLQVLAVSTVALLHLACGKSGGSAGGAAADWNKVTTEDGFSMSVPPGWDAIDFTSRDARRVMNSTLSKNPNLKSMESQLKAMVANASFKLFIANRAGSANSGFAENIIVADEPLATGATPVQTVQATAITFKQMGSKIDPAAKKITLPGGDAYQLEASLHLVIPNKGDLTTFSRTYMFFRGDRVTTVGFTTANGQRSRAEPLFRRMAETVRFK